VTILVVLVLLSIFFTILHYVSQAALMRMVDGYESNGEKVSWRKGWRMGWSRQAWRLFLINVLIAIPVTLVFLALFGCAMLPMILSAVNSEEPGAAAIVAFIGGVVLLILLGIIVGVVISLVIEIIYRQCVLADLGVRASIRQGWEMVRKNFKDVGLMWLALVGVKIVYAIVMIPLALLFVGVGLLFGGGLGVLVYTLIYASMAKSTAIIWAAIIGGTLLALVVGLPMLFCEGLAQTYFSSSWTLAYRELRARKEKQAELPAADTVVEPLPDPN
jgi:hypothetical protein